MARKLIHTEGRNRAAPLMVAKVYRDPEIGGYLVRFYKDGTRLRPEADYETNDREDAIGTARLCVERAHTLGA
jgi:hypothetical protein